MRIDSIANQQPTGSPDGQGVGFAGRWRKAAANGRRGAFHGLFSDVEWTAGYVGLLLYVFAVVTYRLPIATPAIGLALAGVLFSRSRIRIPTFLIVFGVFILWGYLGYTQSWYRPEVWEQLVLLTKLWLIAFAAVNALRTRAQIRFFLVFFLVCFATHPARGAIFNYLGGYTRFGRALWNRVYANPNDLAALTLFPLALAITLIKDINIWVRRGAIVSIVVLAALILMTQSRGGFLALVVMALMVWQTQRRKLRAFMGVLLLGTTAVLIAPSGVWERMLGLAEEGSEADSSSRQRWEIWQVAREVSARNPVFGIGIGAFPLAHESWARHNAADYTQTRGYKDAHSTYLSVLAEAGWPGLALFVTMIGISLKQAWTARRRLPGPEAGAVTVMAVALVGFMVAAVFGTFSQLSFLYLHLALLSALCSGVGGLPQAKARTRVMRRPVGPGHRTGTRRVRRGFRT
jgi:probable O-glycosylation ligase (exosortase A-associated)